MFPVKLSQRMHMFRTGRKMAPGGSARVASKPLYSEAKGARRAMHSVDPGSRRQSLCVGIWKKMDGLSRPIHVV